MELQKGRPMDTTGRLAKETRTYDLLDSLGIEYNRIDHAPAMTMEVCRKIRQNNQTPIIMLTAKGETYDKVLGLELGADDYIVKPFETKEVTARIKAVLRRCGSKDEENKGVYDFDNLHLDMNRYELKVKGKVVDAPPKELELLACLAGHPNRVYTRDQLLDEVWGFEYYGDSRTIDVHVKRLREKLEGASEQWNLKTVWGVGYKFEVKE